MSDIQARLADPNDPFFCTPVGRYIGGSIWEKTDKDWQGNPKTILKGPKAGLPDSRYRFIVAFPKNNPAINLFFAKMFAEAKKGFPQLFNEQNQCIRPDFSFKYVDGDSTEINKSNKRPCDQPNYPGNWVFFFSGSGDIPLHIIDQQINPITDPNAVKRGYWVRVMGHWKENAVPNNPGVYLNPSTVQLCGYGEEIIFGPDAKEVFGAAPINLPTGASATPLAPASIPSPVNMPGMLQNTSGTLPAMPFSPSSGQIPVQATPAPYQPTQVTPVPNFLNPPMGQHAQQPPSPAPTPAPIPAPAPAPMSQEIKYRLANGSVFTKQQLLNAGHTEAHLATYQIVS